MKFAGQQRCLDRDIRGKRGKCQSRRRERFVHPLPDWPRYFQALFGDEHPDLPHADGRKGEVMFARGGLDGCEDFRVKFVAAEKKPDKAVCIEKQRRHCSASHCSPMGEIISPAISIDPAIEPKIEARLATAIGTTRATGRPRFVTTYSEPCFSTSSRSLRQCALNSLDGIGAFMTITSIHGHLNMVT